MKGTRTSQEGDRDRSNRRVLAGGGLSAVLWGPGPGVDCKWLQSQYLSPVDLMSKGSSRTLEPIDGHQES